MPIEANEPKRLLLALVVVVSGCAFASPQAEFCAGFADGYMAMKGGGVVLPVCPAMPATSAGSTPFRQGIKLGMQAAGGR